MKASARSRPTTREVGRAPLMRVLGAWGRALRSSFASLPAGRDVCHRAVPDEATGGMARTGSGGAGEGTAAGLASTSSAEGWAGSESGQDDGSYGLRAVDGGMGASRLCRAAGTARVAVRSRAHARAGRVRTTGSSRWRRCRTCCGGCRMWRVSRKRRVRESDDDRTEQELVLVNGTDTRSDLACGRGQPAHSPQRKLLLMNSK